MSKKKMKELEKERVNFIHGNEELGIDGAIKRGVPEAVAASLFDEIMDFANYAFNKAHAVCYAVVSFRTAYLKCHYPREYMAALLTSVLDVSEKISEYIQTAREMGISVQPPDVNLSYDSFSVANSDIRFGLAAVKGVGRSFMKQLVDEREKNGIFTSFQDFCERMYDRELNRRALECLIKAGAFDSMGCRRSQLLRVAGPVVDAIAQNRKKNIEGQMDLFGMGNDAVQDTQIALPDIPEVSKRELLAMEKETTGLYLSGHPMDEYRELAARAEGCARAQDHRRPFGRERAAGLPGRHDRAPCLRRHRRQAQKHEKRFDDGVCDRGGRHGGHRARRISEGAPAVRRVSDGGQRSAAHRTHRRARGGGAQGAAERGTAAERGRGKRAHDCGKAGRERIFRRGSGEKGAAQAVYPPRQPEGRQMARHPRGALDLSRRHAGLSVSARHEENDARLAPSVVPAGRKHFAKITLPLERG